MNYSIICISQPVQGGGGGGCFLGDVDYVVQLCCFSGRGDCVCISCRGPSAAHHSTAVFDLVNAMNSSPPMITYDWISKGRYWLSCAVSPVFLTVGIAFLFMQHIGWRLAGGVSIFLGLAMLIQKKTILDKSGGSIHVVHRFLGCCPLRQRTFRLDLFDAVVIERRETYHPAWPHAESKRYDILYRVGLRRKQGQSLWVRNDSFSNGQPYLRVEELARRLAGDTGLQIVEIDVAQSKWH